MYFQRLQEKLLLAPSSAEIVHSAGAPALEEEKVEICYHTVQTKLSLTSGRPETVMVEDDTPRVADLPKTFALGLLQRICFRKSDVRLDIGHLSRRYCSASQTKGFNPLVACICPLLIAVGF